MYLILIVSDASTKPSESLFIGALKTVAWSVTPGIKFNEQKVVLIL